MFLNNKYCFVAATFMAITACAQQPTGTPQTKSGYPLTKGGYPLVQQLDKSVTYASAADMAALIDKAQKESKDGAAIVVGEFLKLAPYTVNLEYREKGKIGDVGNHPKDVELVYVLQGSGTLVTGGKPAADRMSIEGGESQKIGKGDFILIPEGVPHWISHEDQTIVLMSVHMPRPVPAK